MRLITLFICILLCGVVQTMAQSVSSPNGQIQLTAVKCLIEVRLSRGLVVGC